MSEENKHEWNIYQKLAYVQHHLKAPKSQFNKFGKYNYRNLEDIQNALKPLLHEVGAMLVIQDSIEFVQGGFEESSADEKSRVNKRPTQHQDGTVTIEENESSESSKSFKKHEGRHYVKATAKFIDCKDGKEIETTAYAREEENKKGMDASQVTGATSSYARKYALNGLFAIDDTKDADSQDNRPESQNQNVKAPFKASDQQLVCYRDLLEVERNNHALFDHKELEILHAVEQKNNEGGWNWVLEMHGKIQDRVKELNKNA